jgi:hypothetical protein
MQSLGMAILMFFCGLAGGWATHEFANRISGYGEAEQLQWTVGDASKLPTSSRSHFGKLLLNDANGDRIVIVNGNYQLRATAGKSAVIEPLGTN